MICYKEFDCYVCYPNINQWVNIRCGFSTTKSTRYCYL